MAKHTPVLFENSRGETITNDPIYKAQQLLAEAGVDQPDETKVESVTPARSDADDDIESDAGTTEGGEETPSEPETDKYDDMSGKELTALAKQREVDISGLKKVGEVRQALRDADTDAE